MAAIRIAGEDAERFTAALTIYAKKRRSSAARLAREIIERELGDELRIIMNDLDSPSFFDESVASIEHSSIVRNRE
jgi:hypothetical protein